MRAVSCSSGRRLASILLAGTLACSDSPSAPPEPVISITPVPASLDQEALAGTALPMPLAVLVTLDGAPAPDIRVTWAASAGTLGRTLSTTDANGRTASAWTLGSVPGVQTASASAGGAASPAVFSARALAETPVPPPPPRQQTGIGINPAGELTVNAGGVYQLSAVAYYDDGSEGQPSLPSWAIDDPSVATVSESGLLTTLATGTATVTLTSGLFAATAPLRVVGPPASLTIDVVNSGTIFVGRSAYWGLRAYDASGFEVELEWGTVTWTSNPLAVALPGPPALGLSPGTAEITATVGTISASAVLTVIGMPDLGGHWTITEWRSTDTYPAYGCQIDGTLVLAHDQATGALAGDHDLQGACPSPSGGEDDLSGQYPLTGLAAAGEVVFVTASPVPCTYRGDVTLDGTGINGNIECPGYEGSFRLSR